MGTRADSSVLDLATKMKRNPLDVAMHVLDSDIPGMIGFKVDAGSEEEAEFLGLALSGVPLQAILRWCTADAQRPTSAELEGMMTGEDWRPALYMACTTGMWLCGPADASALRFLASQPQAPVEIAVREVLARFDAPTPTVVAMQLLGMGPGPEIELPWTSPSTCSRKSTKRKGKDGYKSAKSPSPRKSSGTRSSKFSSDAARRKFWAKRNAKRKSYA